MPDNIIVTPYIPDGHPDIPKERVGLLLINLGTPEGTDFWSIRRYLKEFLGDPRVIEINRVFWALILNLIILNIRPRISAKAYKAIWIEETNESPLRFHTRNQSDKLLKRFEASELDVEVNWAMRYGTPSIPQRLNEMKARGCRKILLFSLYPLYSATTTASAYDKAFEALALTRWQPAIRSVPAYYNNDMYIEAIANSVKRHFNSLDWNPEVLVTSFHGLPKRYLDEGDPYHCQCAQTSRLLTQVLGLSTQKVRLAFQSRFGREEWLKPYIQEVITDLPKTGVKRLAVVSPGFAADCVETLEEVAIGLRETFLSAGGEKFTYIPCLNATPDGIDLLQDLASQELAGWVEFKK